jgi:hypothetical protein
LEPPDRTAKRRGIKRSTAYVAASDILAGCACPPVSASAPYSFWMIGRKLEGDKGTQRQPAHDRLAVGSGVDQFRNPLGRGRDGEGRLGLVISQMRDQDMVIIGEVLALRGPDPRTGTRPMQKDQ